MHCSPDPLAFMSATSGDVQIAPGAEQGPPGKEKEEQILRQRASMEVMEYLVVTKKELKKEERCRKAFAL
jgi:hypothetical protein